MRIDTKLIRKEHRREEHGSGCLICELADEVDRLEHAMEQACLILFACKGPREAFRARNLLEKTLDE